MKTKNQLFNLDILVGNWESVNLNPTVMINGYNHSYTLSIIYMNETTGQAHPATYEIQQDADGYHIYCNCKRLSISYDARLDTLTVSTFGDYMRN
ncbi:hypothetical protein FACS1894162_4650 [Bacteroidia bacterium]|nr:hypothetical protein FACS1894162_4650 [Bacteroidia bacterium]